MCGTSLSAAALCVKGLATGEELFLPTFSGANEISNVAPGNRNEDNCD